MASRQSIAAAGRHLHSHYLISLLAMAQFSHIRERDEYANATGRDVDDIARL